MNIDLFNQKFNLLEVDEIITEARAILFNEDGLVLVAKVDGMYMFPGCVIKGETQVLPGLVKYLSNGSTVKYENHDFSEDMIYYTTGIDAHYLSEETKEDVKAFRRTHYYPGSYKGIPNDNGENIKYSLLTLDTLKSLVLKNKNNNPRNEFYKKEMLDVIKYLENNKIYDTAINQRRLNKKNV